MWGRGFKLPYCIAGTASTVRANAAAITSALLSVQAVRSETLDAPVGPCAIFIHAGSSTATLN